MSSMTQHQREDTSRIGDRDALLRNAALYAWEASDFDLGMALFEASRKAREELALLLKKGEGKMVPFEAARLRSILDRSGETYEDRLINTVLPTVGARLFEKSGVTPMLSRSDRALIDDSLMKHPDPTFRAHCGFVIQKANLKPLTEALRDHLIARDGLLCSLDIVGASVIDGSAVEIALSRAAPPLPDARDILSRRIKEACRAAGVPSGAGVWEPELFNAPHPFESRAEHIGGEHLPELIPETERRAT